MSFTDKVVLITGAGSGIGEATAIAFANLSAKLSLFDKDKESLSKVCECCEKLNQTKVLKFNVNVSVDEEIRKGVEQTLSELGRIDVVVNCAGMFEFGSVLDINLMDAYDRGMNVNLRAIVSLTNLVAPSLTRTKGNIVNISSTSSRLVTAGWLPYNVSKAGLSHFTKCAALELASKGVRVNSILPGPVKTNIGINCGVFNEQNNDKFWYNLGKATPLGNFIEPNEVADLVVYLASEKAKSITGAEYSLDCGLLLSGEQPLVFH